MFSRFVSLVAIAVAVAVAVAIPDGGVGGRGLG